MTLELKAKRLIKVLDTICMALEVFGNDYTNRCAGQLRPLVECLRQAVVEDRSRDHAAAVLREIKPIMHELCAMATKGEMAIFTGNELDVWWELSTIFQESRYSRDAL